MNHSNSNDNSNDNDNNMLLPPAKNRIKRELSQLSLTPPPGISCHSPRDTLTYLHSTITGPPSTPFSSGIFLLTITIPRRYPFEPPAIRFVTPIHHPNIDAMGRICLDTLKHPPNGCWSPAVSLPSLLLSIRALMGQPNGEDGLVVDVTRQYREDYKGWERDARILCEREATGDMLVRREEEIRLRYEEDLRRDALAGACENGNGGSGGSGGMLGSRNGARRGLSLRMNSKSKLRSFVRVKRDKENQHQRESENDNGNNDDDNEMGLGRTMVTMVGKRKEYEGANANANSGSSDVCMNTGVNVNVHVKAEGNERDLKYRRIG